MRRKKWKKQVSIFLCMALTLVMLVPQISARGDTYVNFDEKVSELQKQYYDGYGDASIWQNYSFTGSSGTQSWQCVAFARMAYQYIYGADWNTCGVAYTNKNEIEKGDYIFYSCPSDLGTTGHGAIVINRSGNIIYTYSANTYCTHNKKYSTVCYNHPINIAASDFSISTAYHKPANVTFTNDHIPVGYVDDVITTANTVTVTGWAYDPDRSSQSLDIHVYIGESDQNRELGKVGTANLSSQDVDNQYGITGNHRFSITFETNRVGTQKIWVYPINIDKNGNTVERHAHIEDGKGVATVNVTGKVSLVGISLNKTSVTLNKGVTDNLTVSYNPTNTTDSKTVTWSSGNTSVAKVDQNGKITAVNKGTTTITAKVGSKTASCNVTVKVPLTGISLNKTTLALNRGVTETLTVNYNPSDTTDSKTVTWSSENTSVAKVDQNGKITAVDVGTTNILAKVGSKTASCSVTVKAPLTGISLNKTTLSLRKQSTETLVVSYDPINTTDDKTITWTSDNEEVATISGGTVSALKEGTATITATVGSCTAQCVVTVEKENTEPVKKPLTAISLDKATMNLKQGSTDTLTVTYTPGDTTDDKTVTWTSDNEEVATVSGGTVSALKEGTATITATVGSCTAQCVVTVVPKQEQPNLPSEPNNYSITEGANGTHKINEDGTYVLRASGELDKFVSIEVDGMLLDSSNYTLKRGSTIVTFTKEYMDQLAVGTHVVKINFTDGVATTSINIQQNTANKNDKKNTGDVTIVNNQAADSANNQVTNTETLTDTKTDEIIVDNSVEVQSPKTGDDNQCMWIFAICFACSFGFILRFKKFKK